MSLLAVATSAHSARGLIASCIRAHAFFSGERSSLIDPTCKYLLISNSEYLLRWDIGTDVSLSIWTLVESGMYLSAACLIGLRPLLSVTSRWFKKQVTTWRRTGSRTDYKKDQDSMSHSLKGDMGGGMRLQSFSRDIEHGPEDSTGSSDIIVRSDIQVTLADQHPKQNTAEVPNVR